MKHHIINIGLLFGIISFLFVAIFGSTQDADTDNSNVELARLYGNSSEHIQNTNVDTFDPSPTEPAIVRLFTQ